MKKIILLLLLAQKLCSQNNTLIIGTYTSTNSKGLYAFNFDTATGNLEEQSSIFTKNPSYLTVSNDKRYIYSVNENGASATTTPSVSSFKFDKNTNQFSFINQQPTNGNHPCYVTLDKTNKWLVAANYSGGNFSIYAIEKDGSIGVPINTIQHFGKSADLIRQDKPHVHSCNFTPNNKFLLVADLGTDQLKLYTFNQKNGILKIIDSLKVNDGAGPRHIDYHKKLNVIYLVEEMSGKVNVVKMNKNGSLNSLQTISVLAPNFQGKIGVADIHLSPDNKFLYVSNRGDANDIAIFNVNEQTGLLTLIKNESVLGKKPRNFSIHPSGKYLLVANQESNEVIIFKRNITTGLLINNGQKINIPSPVCLKWL